MQRRKMLHTDPTIHQEREWEPEPLHLPVPDMPYWPEPPRRAPREDEQEDARSGGVVIIDMNDYSEWNAE
jgi:hypothetical protein